MEKKSALQRIFGHLHTVGMHRRSVRKNCFSCGLIWQGLTHDLSKYSWAELAPSIRFYQGNRSPYAYEKELIGYSTGWLHHKGRNKHHWEYWYDLIHGQWQAVSMPDRYIAEMACDRVAACKTYLKDQYTQKSALEYFLSKPDRNYMHPHTQAVLQKILTDIAENGEAHAFASIKQCIKSGNPLPQ